MKDALKIVGVFLLWSSICLFGGWKINTYYTGYQTSLKQEVTQVVEQGMRDIQFNQAELLTGKIDEIMKQDFKVQKEKETIIERPIYSQQCIDNDGINLLKQNQEKYNEIRKKGS